MTRRRRTFQRTPRHWNGKTQPQWNALHATAFALGMTALALAIAFGSLSTIGITL